MGSGLTNNTGNPPQYAQQDIDQQVGAASRLEEYGEKRQEYSD
jgi:hypothetical protein